MYACTILWLLSKWTGEKIYKKYNCLHLELFTLFERFITQIGFTTSWWSSGLRWMLTLWWQRFDAPESQIQKNSDRKRQTNIWNRYDNGQSHIIMNMKNALPSLRETVEWTFQNFVSDYGIGVCQHMHCHLISAIYSTLNSSLKRGFPSAAGERPSYVRVGWREQVAPATLHF